MKPFEKIYNPENTKEYLVLTEKQKEAVQNITLGVTEVNERVRTMAMDDVIATLENGHPLNRIFEDKDKNVAGYIACEDFVSCEAYIKYFAVDRQAKNTGRNIMYLSREIPNFFEYAKQRGYAKINMHGWNERLNRVLEHEGFKRLRTDIMGDFAADFYEKTLAEEKSSEVVSEERKIAFEKKYLNMLEREYQQTVKIFSEDKLAKKEMEVNGALRSLSGRLSSAENFEFGNRQKAVLKLKLARYFQNNETCDVSTLYDAIIETPKFIGTDKGSLNRLLEVHEQKTLEKIAEIRKKRADMKGDETFNPYENLFTTKSGDYYMARLLNMPHLKQESEYMNHCVGTSDSYVNRIKKGEIEILSFRRAPKVEPRTGRIIEEKPLITIEYNLKTKEIKQMKKADDEYLSINDQYYKDVIGALKQLRMTKTDTGDLRNFSRINSSELGNITVRDYYLLTEEGEVHFKDFDPDKNIFILKTGKMEIDKTMPRKDMVKILRIVENIKVDPEEIAFGTKEITEKTKAYIGDWNMEIFQKIRNYPNIKHLYESFPDKKIFMQTLETDPSINSPESAEEAMERNNIYRSDWGKDILYKTEFSKEKQVYNLVRFTVEQLGFSNGATTQEIYEKAEKLGLELCPAEVGPHLRLQYHGKEWMIIAMKQIADRYGYPYVFRLHWNGEQLTLNGNGAGPSHRWTSDYDFVFRFRKES